MDALDDGETHINIYSKGYTELGRFLSNFAHYPVQTEDGEFASIEGYWYWLSCKDDKLRKLYGWEAKKYGRKVRAADGGDGEDFKRKICGAIKTKIMESDMLYTFYMSELPFKHYYVYGGKIVEPKEGKWIIEFIEELRKQVKLAAEKHR